MSSPSSLRDLYAPPPDAWSFAPPPANGTQQAASPQAPTYQWSARSTSKHPLGLSGAVPEGGVDIRAFAQGLLTAALLQYATSAVIVPWEVGKTLLQVQWVPQDVEARLAAKDEEEEEEPLDELNEEPSYFTEPTLRNDEEEEDRGPPPRMTDERGYIIRQSIADEEVTPEYIIPVGSAAGTWGMMNRVKSFRPEGWLSLWKGLFTTTATELLSASLQPVVGTVLESLLSPSLTDSAAFTPTPVFIPMATQIVTGFILSPLDLVRTRLIVQSSGPRHKSYSGPFDALKQILEHEGGLRGIYLHPQLLWPTLIDCTLRSVVPFALSSFMSSYLAISPETHPFTLTCVELLANFTGLLITTPFETIRRRLQVQVRGTAKPLKACVELRPVPYVGMVDAFYRIVTEERSDLPLKPKRRRRKSVDGKAKAEEEDVEQPESWLRHTGIGQLYRGLGLRLGASLTVFVLALTTKDEADAGWAEL